MVNAEQGVMLLPSKNDLKHKYQSKYVFLLYLGGLCICDKIQNENSILK